LNGHQNRGELRLAIRNRLFYIANFR